MRIPLVEVFWRILVLLPLWALRIRGIKWRGEYLGECLAQWYGERISSFPYADRYEITRCAPQYLAIGERITFMEIFFGKVFVGSGGHSVHSVHGGLWQS